MYLLRACKRCIESGRQTKYCEVLGARSASSAFRYNVYRPCAPRMEHLSIHGCTCCVPASVVSKVADKQSTAKCWEPEAQVRHLGITCTGLVRQGWST